jgi:Xaa-Pro dipeptidase
MTGIATQRIAALRKRMAAARVDLTVLGPTSHMRWLAGLNPHGDERPVLLFVSQSYAGLLIPGLNAASVRQHTDLPFHCWRDEEGPSAALADLLAKTGVNADAVSLSLDEAMRADFALLVLDALPGAKRQFLGATVGALRAEKSEDEYRALKASAVLNDRAVEAGFAALREGITEAEVAEVIATVYAQAGATTEFTSVCFGGNGAFPHHHTGDTPLARDTAVLIDAGARHMGYPSDMTRVGWFGTPSAEFLKVAEIVECAVVAALMAAQPGAPASAVDNAARSVIATAGYGAMFQHRTGHGLGIDIHEEPYITATATKPLRPGNVFTIEPGIYLAGTFGLRLEEVVFLRPDGPEVLSEMPRHPVICT